jgi:predicted ATP-dependent endonuclease of OLD family
MKIKKIVLENVKSFREKTEIEFNEGLNIFIGPNAGGKSNLMDIINMLLRHHLIYPHKLTYISAPSGEKEKFNIEQIPNIYGNIERALERNLEKKYEGQTFKITFQITEGDKNNFKIIKANYEKLIEFEKNNCTDTLLQGSPDFANQISKISEKDIEYEFIHPTMHYKNKDGLLFQFYLNHYEFICLLSHKYNSTVSDDEKILPLYPLTLFFSPYRIQPVNTIIDISGTDEIDFFENCMKDTTNKTSHLLNYSFYYFALKFLYCNDDKTKFKDDPEVKFIQKYIQKLGYDYFNVVLIDRKKNKYNITLTKGVKVINLSKISSGEREIIYILFGIFAFYVNNGIVIIDEPDLHLHPQWQKILIELFNDLAEERQIQFFISTHSPHFITPNTINNTFRIYKEDDTSKVFPFNKVSKEKDIFQIVNSLNNEKIFFADKIILVEGYVDRIIYRKILEIMQKDQKNNKVIEIIEVYGKDNFKKFQEFLEELKIENYILADFDYICDIGSEEVKNLLKTDFDKIRNSIQDKGSKDVKSLLELLDKSVNKMKDEITDDDISNLKDLFKYIKSRYINIKDINKNNFVYFNSFIEDKYNDNIFILKKGEIEDYFQDVHFDIERAMQVANNIESVKDVPEEMKDIFSKILNS